MAEFEELRDQLAARPPRPRTGPGRRARWPPRPCSGRRAHARHRPPTLPDDLSRGQRAGEAASTGGRPRPRRRQGRLADARSPRRGARRGPDRAFTDPVDGSRAPVRPALRSCCSRCGSRRGSSSSPTGQPQLWVRVYPDDVPGRRVRGVAHRDGGRRNGSAFWAGDLAGVRRRGPRAGGVARARRDLRLGPGRLDRPPLVPVESRRPARRGRRHACASSSSRPTRSRPRCSDYWSRDVGGPAATAPPLAQARGDLDAALGAAAADARRREPAGQPRRAGAGRGRRPDVAEGHRAAAAESRRSSAPAHDVVVERAARRRAARTGLSLLAYADPDTAPGTGRARQPGDRARCITGPDPNAAPAAAAQARRRRPRPPRHAADPGRPALDVRLRAGARRSAWRSGST